MSSRHLSLDFYVRVRYIIVVDNYQTELKDVEEVKGPDMLEAQKHFETKPVYVAWTNSDLTEGRGFEYPLCVSESLATVKRFSKGKNVQGSNARIKKAHAIRIDGSWYAPIKFERSTGEDNRIDLMNEKKLAAWQKAKDAGLSEADLEALTTNL